jgi:predicted acetyltransferase
VFLIKVADEIAGFVLLNQEGIFSNTNWKIDQFFILAKFQGKGVGNKIAHQIWNTYPGLWEVSIIPDNKSALDFWRRAISTYAKDYHQTDKQIDNDAYQSNRIIFSFDSGMKNPSYENQSTYNLNIRRLTIHDLQSYFDLRLESLQNAPTNFMSSYEEEKTEGLSLYQNFLMQEGVDNLIFGAFMEGKLIGSIGIFKENKNKAKHKSYIWGMYVQPTHRNLGVGKALLKQAIDHANNALKSQIINISVEATNISAKKLYESFGFQEWGKENHAMQINGNFFDEIHMSLILSHSS